MPRKVPMRQCLGCRVMKPKRELVRVVRSPEGEVSLDFTGKKPGRGAYVCDSAECLKRAIKSKALSRAFGVEIPQSVTDALIQYNIDSTINSTANNTINNSTNNTINISINNSITNKIS